MSRFVAISILAAGLALSCATSCSEPSDVVAAGDLCLPETGDCPASVDLRRDGVGKNGLEFTLHNRSGDADDASTVAIRATTGDDIAIPDERPETEDGRLVLYDEEFAPAAGDVVRERIDAYHLTVTPDLRLELECLEGACDHRLEYLHLSEAIECIDDAACGRTQFCEPTYGRCAECTADADCEGDQTCRREEGRCHPGDTTGCHIADPTGPHPGGGLAVVAALLVVAALRFRSKKTLGTLVAVLVLASLPTVASADTGASMHIGGGMRVLTGQAGDLTRPGWGLDFNQQIRWRSVGAMVELSTHSFGFENGAPDAADALAGYGITVGPRGFVTLPIRLPFIRGERPFELVGALDYTRWNVAENRLARLTGLDLRYHALGPTVGLNWEWKGLGLTARANYSHIFGWPGGVFSFDLTVGIGP